MDLEMRSKSEREIQVSYDSTYKWNPQKSHKWTYLQSKNILTGTHKKIYGYQKG